MFQTKVVEKIKTHFV